jgi:hypothetical protein
LSLFVVAIFNVSIRLIEKQSKEINVKYPTEYRIEIYLDSFSNDPIASFCSTTPFMVMQLGDEIDPFAWSGGNDESYANSGEVLKGHALEVIKIRHLMMVTNNKTIQSISVKVKAVKYSN